MLALTSVLVVLLLITACGNQETEDNDEEVITLTASAGIPGTHLFFEAFMNEWIEKIEEESNGQIEFEVFTGGELAAVSTELDALESGMIDVALPLVPIYDPQRHPLTDVAMLPLLETDSKIATAAYDELLHSDEALDGENTYYDIDYGKYDLKLFSMAPTSPYVLTSATQEFKTKDDFKGSLIRTSGRAQEYFVENIGASSTTIDAADVFEAVSRGTVDGNVQSVADWVSYGFEDIHKYTLEGLYLGHHPAPIAMTEETWDSLPENIQEIFTNVTSELLSPSGEYWDNKDKEVKEENIENGGEFIKLSDLDEETNELVKAGIEETWLEWIEKREKDGQPGLEAAKLWRDLIIKHGGKVPEAVMDLD